MKIARWILLLVAAAGTWAGCVPAPLSEAVPLARGKNTLLFFFTEN